MGEAVVGVGHSLEQLVERLKKRYDPEIDAKILNVYLSGSRFVPPPPLVFLHTLVHWGAHCLASAGCTALPMTSLTGTTSL